MSRIENFDQFRLQPLAGLSLQTRARTPSGASENLTMKIAELSRSSSQGNAQISQGSVQISNPIQRRARIYQDYYFLAQKTGLVFLLPLFSTMSSHLISRLENISLCFVFQNQNLMHLDLNKNILTI